MEIVEILNIKGDIISEKFRKDINKKKDIYSSLQVLAFQNGDIVGEIIPPGKLYSGRIGSTACVVMRKGESKEEAIKRCCSKFQCEAYKLGNTHTEMVRFKDSRVVRLTTCTVAISNDHVFDSRRYFTFSHSLIKGIKSLA